MPREPVLSVIVPAFQVAPYVRQAVESALRQTAADLEVIAVEGESSDGTFEQLEAIRDGRLRLIRHRNRGLANARNLGLKAARGPYIGFLDGDDLWQPAKAERHLEFLEAHPETDLTFSLSATIDESGREVGFLRTHPPGPVSFRELFVASPVGNGSAVVARRESLERAGLFDITLPYFEDLDLWLRVARLRPGNIACIPEVLTLYRRWRGQLTSDWRPLEGAWQQVREKVARYAPEEIGAAEAAASRERRLYYAFLLYEKRLYAEAARRVWTNCRQAPRTSLKDSRTWLLAAACFSGRLLPARLHRAVMNSGASCQRRLIRFLHPKL